jgi:hypothetical protein
MEDPRWKEGIADGTTYEQAFVNIMDKEKTVENFGKGDGEDPDWRSSPGAMKWLNENYNKKSAGKRRKTRKTKKKKTRRSKKSTRK